MNTGFSTKNNIAGKRKTLGFCSESYVSVLVYFGKPSSEQHAGVSFLVEPNPQGYTPSAITLPVLPKDLWSVFLLKAIFVSSSLKHFPSLVQNFDSPMFPEASLKSFLLQSPQGL